MMLLSAFALARAIAHSSGRSPVSYDQDIVPQPCTQQPCCLKNGTDAQWNNCMPGYEFCGMISPEGWSGLRGGPQFHLKDRTGCGENDPNVHH